MKTLRTASVILAAVLLALVLITFFLPSKYRVRQDIQIQASPERVYGLIANVKEWSSWYPMYRLEPLAEYLYVGQVQEVDSHMSWRGLDIGEGQILLTEVNPPFSVRMEKSLTSPEHAVSTYHWSIEELEPGTVQVTWTEEGDLEFPLGRWRGLFLSSSLGPRMAQGLEQLKTVAELQPLEPPSVPLDPFPNSPSHEEE